MYKTYTKKEIERAEALVNEVAFDMMTITQDLIYTLDFSVRNNLVYYNNNPFFFNDQCIWYVDDVVNPPKNMFTFTPLYNPKFTQALFKHFITLYSMRTGYHVLSYFTIIEGANDGYRANVRFRINGIIRDFVSDVFENESVAYIDLIYKLDNRPEDLSMIDKAVSYMSYKFYMERTANK